MNSLEQIQKNIDEILSFLGGRATLLAATKTVPADIINPIYDMGVHTIGENRVGELLEKLPLLDPRFDVHFIGRLQRNKAKYIVGKVSLIHSLDSLPLAEEINRQAAKRGITQDCLVEINLGEEESKGGVPLDGLDAFLREMPRFPNVKVRGLTGVLPKSADRAANVLLFTKIAEKFIDIKGHIVDNRDICNSIVSMETLSLGMTADYRDAVACGSTLVRIGEGIFGARTYTQAP